MMGIMDQINQIIKNKIKNKNGDLITGYSQQNTEAFGNKYVLKINGKRRDYFDTIKAMNDFLNKNGWNIKEKHGS